jgi:hypothetical protein
VPTQEPRIDPDFGGHAKRNQFNLDGHLHLMASGTLEIVQIETATIDYMPGLSSDEKKQRMSYEAGAQTQTRSSSRSRHSVEDVVTARVNYCARAIPTLLEPAAPYWRATTC